MTCTAIGRALPAGACATKSRGGAARRAMIGWFPVFHIPMNHELGMVLGRYYASQSSEIPFTTQQLELNIVGFFKQKSPHRQK